jgi:hypothetical protein
MDDYVVEIEVLREDLVVLAVPVLRLLVYGRSLDEAVTRARSSIAFRLLENGPREEPALAIAFKVTEGVGRRVTPRREQPITSGRRSRRYAHDRTTEADLAV